ncbi:MAG: hypothetical protein KY395_02180 [Actinobacteria bacterium]|nr:hypothetical protein [Actinomycetota bacterium]
MRPKLLQRPPKFIANFDSSTAMVRATARFLHGRDFPALGLSPLLKVPAAWGNVLPKPLRRSLYLFSGWNESIRPDTMGDISMEELSEWVGREYPEREYPAVAIGSSNGAGVHLCCAMGMPWLPQTFLIPVRQPVHPDEPKEALEIGKDPGRALLDANPDLQLHHMHDANQDRIMVRTMTYFRVKRRRLGDGYTRFLEERLPPGGTIFVFDCRRTWPTTQVGDRHVFQHGALGGATEEEFLHGSERVEAYLEREESHRRRWDSPEPDGESPEAEWGFEPELMQDIERMARRRGYRVRRIVYTEPEDLSPFVADLYRWWYAQRGIDAARLLVEQFIVMEPWWALRTGSVPFWLEFNMERSLRTIRQYLDKVEPYRDIRLMMMNHGVEAVGLPTATEWESIFDYALHHGRFVGADADEFPMDYAQFSRYHTEARKIAERRLMPSPLIEEQLDQFIAKAGNKYAVSWDDGAGRQ